jgi:hypothetical protein
MAISIRTPGTWVAANATTQTVTLPTHQTGDMLIVRVGMKHATLPGDITCNTSGWARIGQFNNGTTASGNGLGDVQVAAFWKEAASGAETNPVITFHASVAATPSAAVAMAYQKGAGETWSTPVGDGGAIAAATSMDATIQTHVSVTAGDMVDAFVVTNDNTTLTVPTVTQTGVTFAAVTESPAAALSSATSNDISADGCYRLANSGTSSAAAHVTGTNSVADVGAAWVTRLRVTVAPPTDTAYTDLVQSLSPDGYWPLDDFSGNARDASGNGRAGTAFGTPTYRATGPTINSESQTATFFDADTDRFEIAETIDDGVSEMTLSLWFNTNDIEDGYWLGKTAGNNARWSWALYKHAGAASAWSFYIHDAAGTAFDSVNGTGDTTDGNWHHLVIWRSADGRFHSVRDGGSQIDDSGAAGTWAGATTDPMVIGAQYGGFNGPANSNLAHVAYWKSDIGATNRTSLYTGTAAPKVPKFTSYPQLLAH